MIKKVLLLLLGTIITAFGIASILRCGLGAFSISLANKGIANLLHTDIAVANFITEGIMLLLAIYYKRGVGITTICSMTISGIFISIFEKILPANPWLCIFFILCPIGWCLQAKAGLGNGSSNELMEALVEHTGKSITFIRFCIELVFLIIAWLLLPDMITIFSVIITFGTAPAINFIYKLFKYNPTQVQHDYLISKKKKQST